jgi:hypothetical protein
VAHICLTPNPGSPHLASAMSVIDPPLPIGSPLTIISGTRTPNHIDPHPTRGTLEGARLHPCHKPPRRRRHRSAEGRSEGEAATNNAPFLPRHKLAPTQDVSVLEQLKFPAPPTPAGLGNCACKVLPTTQWPNITLRNQLPPFDC